MTFGYTELSKVRHNYPAECHTPNISTIWSPTLYKILLHSWNSFLFFFISWDHQQITNFRHIYLTQILSVKVKHSTPCLLFLTMCYWKKNPNRGGGGWGDTFLKTSEIFRFVTLPLETPKNTSFHHWECCKIVWHLLEVLIVFSCTPIEISLLF